jgi:uncharacterized protein YciI
VRQAVLEGLSAVDRLFAVTRIRGPAWDPSAAMEAQADWPAHAVFMNRLHAEEFVLLGGPLDGTPDVLLIVRARHPAEIEQRLSEDPWSGNGLLKTVQVRPWTLRLGALGGPGRRSRVGALFASVHA